VRNLVLGACLALSVLVAGCGQPIENNASAPAGGEAVNPATTTGGTAVSVTVTEWNVAVEPSTVKPGMVTLKIANAGSEPHGLYAEGPGVDRKGPLIAPGESGELSLDLPAGEYTLFDFVKDNETAHDMRATLTVQ